MAVTSVRSVRQDIFQIRYLLLCLGIGAVFTLLLFGLSEIGVAQGLTGALLSPGLLLAALLGGGVHDLWTYYMIGVGDTLLYGMISFFLLYLKKCKAGSSK